MSLSFCLCTGLGGLADGLPYFYIVYMTILLVHRIHRDQLRLKVRAQRSQPRRGGRANENLGWIGRLAACSRETPFLRRRLVSEPYRGRHKHADDAQSIGWAMSLFSDYGSAWRALTERSKGRAGCSGPKNS